MDRLGAIFARLGLSGIALKQSWSPLGPLLGRLGGLLGRLGRLLGRLGQRSWAVLGPSSAVWGPSWVLLGRLGGRLGRIEALLEAFWAVLAAS